MDLISWPATIGTVTQDIRYSSFAPRGAVVSAVLVVGSTLPLCVVDSTHALYTKVIAHEIKGPVAQWSAHYWLLAALPL
ncbi:unnamed protein product, partial [Clonostachys solani]